jgi:hypothetical protein
MKIRIRVLGEKPWEVRFDGIGFTDEMDFITVLH